MVEKSNDKVGELLAEGHELVARLSEELGAMKAAAELLDAQAERERVVMDGLADLVVGLEKFVGVIGGVAEELDQRRLSDLLSAIGSNVEGVGQEVLRAVEGGNTTVLDEIRQLRAELVEVRDLAERSANRKGLYF